MKPEQGFYSIKLTHNKSRHFEFETVEIIPDTTKDNFDSALRFKGYDLNKFSYNVINKI